MKRKFTREDIVELGNRYDKVESLILSDDFNKLFTAWLDIYALKIVKDGLEKCLNELAHLVRRLNCSDYRRILELIRIAMTESEYRFLPSSLQLFIMSITGSRKRIHDHIENRFYQSQKFSKDTEFVNYTIGCSLTANCISELKCAVDLLQIIDTFAKPVPFDFVYDNNFLHEHENYPSLLIGPDSKLWTINRNKILSVPSDLAFQAFRLDAKYATLNTDYLTFNNNFFRHDLRELSLHQLTDGMYFELRGNGHQCILFGDCLLQYDWTTQKLDIISKSSMKSLNLPQGILQKSFSRINAYQTRLFVLGQLIGETVEFDTVELTFKCSNKLFNAQYHIHAEIDEISVNTLKRGFEDDMTCEFPGGIVLSHQGHFINIETPINKSAFKFHWEHDILGFYAGEIFPYCFDCQTFITIIDKSVYGIVPWRARFPSY